MTEMDTILDDAFRPSEFARDKSHLPASASRLRYTGRHGVSRSSIAYWTDMASKTSHFGWAATLAMCRLRFLG